MLFNLTLRIYTLRLLLIATITLIPALIVARLNNRPQITYLWIGLAFEILIHQILSNYVWAYFYEICDLILLSCEIVAWFLLGLLKLSVNRYSTQNDVILTATLYVVVSGLLISWIFRVAHIIKSRGQTLLKPLDVFASCDHVITPLMRRSVFLGRAIWRSPFRGERRYIKFVRGLFASALFAAIIIFSIFAVILEPLRELGLIPARDYHATDVVYDFNMALPVLSILAFIDMRLAVATDIEMFKSAITVTPFWDDSDPNKPDCVHLPGNMTFGGQVFNVQSDPHIQVITIFCPSRQVKMDPQSLMTASSSITSPDLLISVNFTALGMSSDTLVDSRMNTVSILVGLTNNTGDVVANTIPTPLFPGHHLCASISREFRRRFMKPPLASWGIFSSSRAFLVTDLTTVLPDPSPLIPRLENTATLRVFGQNDNSEWAITQDYRQNSVWSGFASVGGFWTFLSGLFVLIFGSRLLRILFGIKPLSIFGVVHIFDRDRMRAEWRKYYAGLVREASAPSSERGVAALFLDHLLDVDLISDDLCVKDEDVRLSDYSMV